MDFEKNRDVGNQNGQCGYVWTNESKFQFCILCTWNKIMWRNIQNAQIENNLTVLQITVTKYEFETIIVEKN